MYHHSSASKITTSRRKTSVKRTSCPNGAYRKHPALRVKSSVLAISAIMVLLSTHYVVAATTVVNSSSSGVTIAADHDSVSITGTGAINASNDGIYNGYNADTIENSGSVTGNGYAIYNVGTISSLVNNGSMSGVTHSGIFNSSGLITNLNNTGSVYGANTGIRNTGTITLIQNSGSVSGGAYAAIDNSPGTIGTIINTGTLTGGLYGIDNLTSSSIGIISNSGTIIGGSYGIYNSSGSISSVSNAGTISGQTGIGNLGGSIGSISNSDLISGSGYALYNNSTGTIGLITNSGTIAGNIYNGSSNDLTIDGGTSSTFGTLTGYSGGVGTITNTLSNVVFGSGNLLLNDNINVGTYIVSNLASTLQVNSFITITGNYSQGSSATLLIGVSDSASADGSSSSDSGYGRLYVTGNSSIASGSTVTLTTTGSTYSFAAGQRYVVVITTGTATYNAGSLIYSATGYTGTVTGATVTDGSNTDLVLTLGSSTSTTSTTSSNSSGVSVSASTANAKSALNGLFNYSGVNTNLLNVFNAAAALSSTSAANSAGAQLSPIANTASAAQSSSASTSEVVEVIGAHVDGLRIAQATGTSGVATGESSTDIAAWGQVFGGKANQGARDNVSGYYSNYKGLLVGADTLLNESWRLGGLLSYANTAVSNTGDNTGSSAHAESYGLMGYAGYTTEHYYLDFSAGAVSHRYNTVRAIDFTGFSGTALGQFNGRQYVSSVRGGYPIKIDAISPDTTLTPIAGLSYSSLRLNGYAETGGNGAALNVNASSNTSLKSEVAAKLERSLTSSYGEIVPSVQLGWRHEFHKNPQQLVASYVNDTTGSSSFTTSGASVSTDTGVLALALTLVRSKNLTLSARYTLEAASGYTGQTADLRLRYQF